MTVRNTALVLVDPFNDFLSRKGQAWLMTRDSVRANGMIGNAQSILEAARRHRMTVAYAPHHRWRPNGLAGRKYLHPIHYMQEKTHIFADGKLGGEFLAELAPQDGDIISSEHLCSSGFAGTDLHVQLQGRGITHLVIIGMITNSCIEATARSAVDLGYHVTLVTDAVAAFSPIEHDLATREIYPRIAHQLTDTSGLLKTLKA